MATLTEIAGDRLALEDLLAERGGDVTDPAVADAVEAWFAELAGREAEKLDGYVLLIRRLEGHAAAAKAEAERMAAAAKSHDGAARRLKDRLLHHLESSGRPRVVTAAGRTVAVQANGGEAPLLVDDILDWDAVPPELVRVTREIDKKAVRQSIEAGADVGFARLGERGRQLRIR